MSNSDLVIGRVDHNTGTTTLVNNTAATRVITVPTNRRWWLFGLVLHNGDNVSRSCYFYANYASLPAFNRYYVGAATVTAGNMMQCPNTTASQYNSTWHTVPLCAGDTLTFAWNAGGASAGGDAYSAADIIELLV